MAFAHMAVSFGPPHSPTPSMIKFPNPGLYINYFICDHYTRFLHYENKPIQIYWKFYHQKMKIFR